MDPDLVVRAQRGDLGAFEALAIAMHARLFRTAHGILRDRAAADDVTQQALIQIWRDIGSLRDPTRFEGWSYRVLVNGCRDEIKRRRRWIASGSSQAEARDGKDAIGSVLDRDELSRGFARLSVDHRTVIVLRYLMDLSVEATAEALGVSSGTVASRLNRALSALRAALEADARPTALTQEVTS